MAEIFDKIHGGVIMLGEIQLDLFCQDLEIDDADQTLSLMRPHKWAHGELGQLPLVSIEVVRYDGRWMWATRLCSRNGAGQGGNALPKWGKFTDSKRQAIQLASDEVRGFMARATTDEQVMISEWLAMVLSSVTR